MIFSIRFKDVNGRDFPKWQMKKLRDVASFFSGGTPLTDNRDYYDGEIPFIKSGEINAAKTEQKISQSGLKNSSAKMVNKGDLLYALYGATSGEVGISKIDGAINQAVLCIRTKESTPFVYYYLEFQKERIKDKYLQGGQGNLSAEIVKSLPIPLPTIKEQNRIADLLIGLDSRINLSTEQVNQIQYYKKSLLQQLFN